MDLPLHHKCWVGFSNSLVCNRDHLLLGHYNDNPIQWETATVHSLQTKRREIKITYREWHACEIVYIYIYPWWWLYVWNALLPKERMICFISVLLMKKSSPMRQSPVTTARKMLGAPNRGGDMGITPWMYLPANSGDRSYTQFRK